MSDKVLIAVVLAVAAVVCVAIHEYFSPFNTCMREADNAIICARNASGR